MKRSWIPAVIVFGGVLALANLVLVPLYCRGGFAVPFLDRANHCLAQGGLSRSSSLLLYFGVVALALLVGMIADRLPRRAPAAAEAKKPEDAKPAAEPVEQAAVAKPAPSVAPTPTAAAEAPKAEEPKPAPPAEAAKPDTPKPDAAPPAAAPAPAPEGPVDLAAVIEAALKSNAPLPTPAPPPVLPKAPPSSVVTPPAVPKPAPMPSVTPPPAPASAASAMPPAPVLPPPPKPTPIPKPWQKPKAFDGTNEELIARFKELAKEGGVEAIAAAQRNLDESTLSALGGGVDPKQHLSQIAHLLLMEDPELKSEVTRGVIVHIAARLKELGVVTNLTPGATA